MIPILRVVDLFSGLNGWSEAFRERGHQIFAIDNDHRFTADAYIDIGDTGAVVECVSRVWGGKMPDVVLASPPCTAFTTMTMGRNWLYDNEPKTESAKEGRRLVLSTIRLMAIWNPDWWVIENPRARLRTLGLLDGMERRQVSYCRLGEARMKPTDLWLGGCQNAWEYLTLPEMCHNGNRDHIPAPRGSRTGTQGGVDGITSAKIPIALSRLVADAVEQRARTKWLLSA